MTKDLKAQSDSQETIACDSEDGGLKDFWIPDYILLTESEVKIPSYVPASPVIVFINSRSGGQLGGELLISYQTLLNENQVFDLSENAPNKVLHQLYSNIEKLKHDGDSLAPEIQRRLRVIVAGGDGTAGWILGVISDLNLAQPPPVATVPLGTGNNLPFAFGEENPGTDLKSVKMFLDQVRHAKEMKVDSWHVLLKMKVPKEDVCDPIPPLELPHSLQEMHRVSQSDEEGYRTFRGGFWNYFSMVSYGFHKERKVHPEKFKNQAAKQSAYAKLTWSQGWFWASLSHPSSSNIAQLADIWIMRKPGHREVLSVPPTIRSIICLNLPSFSGGLDSWGTPSKSRVRMKDGLVHTSMMDFLKLLDSETLGTVRFYMLQVDTGPVLHRMDGEPWKQPLPKEDGTVIIEISCFGQVNMLATENHQSKSVNDPSTPRTRKENDSDSDEEEAIEDISEEKKVWCRF